MDPCRTGLESRSPIPSLLFVVSRQRPLMTTAKRSLGTVFALKKRKKHGKAKIWGRFLHKFCLMNWFPFASDCVVQMSKYPRHCRFDCQLQHIKTVLTFVSQFSMRRLRLIGRSGDRIEKIWTLSAGLSVVGPGHRADLTGCLQLVAFNGRRKTESNSLCLLKMPSPPW